MIYAISFYPSVGFQFDELDMLHTSLVNLNSVCILPKHSHTCANFLQSSLSMEDIKLLEEYVIGPSTLHMDGYHFLPIGKNPNLMLQLTELFLSTEAILCYMPKYEAL